ncbi:hypothetical protein ACQFYA_21305 [Promicromonospora sp. Marseille-Q5078]
MAINEQVESHIAHQLKQLTIATSLEEVELIEKKIEVLKRQL